MSRRRNIFERLIRSRWETRREALLILYTLFRVHAMTLVLPARNYFRDYFSEREPHIADIQLFRRKVRLFYRVKGLLPYRVPCLVSSMALFDVLRRDGMINPIHLGVRLNGSLDAHAWNWHQDVEDYQILV